MPDGPTPESGTGNVRHLAEKFIEGALKWVAASSKGYVNHAFDLAQVIKQAKEELLSEGPAGQETLVGLMKHENPGVRYWAATGCLHFATADAVAVLEELDRQRDDPAVRLHAGMSLLNWRAGRKLS